jgi:hypothetical protein
MKKVNLLEVIGKEFGVSVNKVTEIGDNLVKLLSKNRGKVFDIRDIIWLVDESFTEIEKDIAFLILGLMLGIGFERVEKRKL